MISLYDILDAGDGQLFGEAGAQLFSDFCFDSRLTKENDLFVALKSDASDVHLHMAEALQRGAVGLLCARPPDFDTEGVSVILVKDVQTALMNWARHVLNKYGTTVIGAAASSGARTVVEAVGHVLAERYRVLTTNHAADGKGAAAGMLLPAALAQLKPEHQVVVLELNAERPRDLIGLLETARPQIGIVSRIGEMRPRGFDSPDQLAAEYDLLIGALDSSGVAVLNYDDDRVRALARRCRAPLMMVGIEGFGADIMAYNVVLNPTRTGFDIRFQSQRFVGRWTPLLGQQGLIAALCALAVGAHFDIPLSDALRSLTEIAPLPGCMRPLNGIGGALIIDDSADADPQSTLDALDWLRAVTDGGQHRAIFVFGDMDSLGDYSQRGHRQVGQQAADFLDLFITEGGEAAAAGRAALDHGLDRRRVLITYSADDVIARLKSVENLSPNDVVLIKGGAAARMERITRALLADDGDQRHLPRAGLMIEPLIALSPHPTWVEIDLNAVAGNVRTIKQIIGRDVSLFAVIKADAYGHGAAAVARTALLNGAEMLAVANIQEALELRDAGIDAPILIMGYTPEQAVRQAVRQNITVTLYDLELARAFDRAARDAGGKLRCHVKIDTGMGRLGVLAAGAVAFFRSLINLKNLEIEGIYTHFATADEEDPRFVSEQLELFRSVLTPLRAGGFKFKYIHAANSAAALTNPDTHFNAVRVGLALYGLRPAAHIPYPPGLKPAMTWKTIIASIKTLPAGHPVGYGSTYRTAKPERVAMLPVGYADGFRRAPHETPVVLVRGRIAPVIGRISMEKTVISVEHIPEAAIGDEVVLLGRQGDAEITADQIAARWGTSCYEVLCSVLARQPRR
jgi:alanine racemase